MYHIVLAKKYMNLDLMEMAQAHQGHALEIVATRPLLVF